VRAYGAGIEYDDIRLFDRSGELKSAFYKKSGCKLRIPDVHLAAEGTQKDT
jgi:hypothetical protein